MHGKHKEARAIVQGYKALLIEGNCEEKVLSGCFSGCLKVVETIST
jgi:hypothetical protein